MNQHLDDLQMAALLAGETDAEAERHLAACASCAAERARLLAAIGDWRSDVELASERPAAFWEGQRRAIDARRATDGTARDSRARPSQRWSTVRWAIAGAAAAAVLAVVVALGIALRPEAVTTVIASATPTPSGMASTPVGTAAPRGSAADDALLFAVEGALARRAPAALEPVEALLHELDRTRRDGGES